MPTFDLTEIENLTEELADGRGWFVSQSVRPSGMNSIMIEIEDLPYKAFYSLESARMRLMNCLLGTETWNSYE
jgi:hypothetical protein